MPVATSLLRDVFGSTAMALIVIGLPSGVDTGIGATNGSVVPVGGFVGSVPSLVNKMVADADQALYLAKRTGKDRVAPVNDANTLEPIANTGDQRP